MTTLYKLQLVAFGMFATTFFVTLSALGFVALHSLFTLIFG